MAPGDHMEKRPPKGKAKHWRSLSLPPPPRPELIRPCCDLLQAEVCTKNYKSEHGPGMTVEARLNYLLNYCPATPLALTHE